MDSKTIDRINGMIAQNNQMNHDLTEILSIATTGWQSDLEGIATAKKAAEDAVAEQVATLQTAVKDAATRAATAEDALKVANEKILELTPADAPLSESTPV